MRDQPLGLRVLTTADVVRHAGVLGSPIAHSLSPRLHLAAYRALGLRWTYEAIETDVAGLPAVLAARADWAGFSCTMPLKRAALEVATEVMPLAAAVGAANTLLPNMVGWTAHNTDVIGVVRAVLDGADTIPLGSATILGAGGTAQAALAALGELGVPTATLLVRDPGRAASARATGEALGLAVEVQALRADAPQLQADLVVSTLPPRAGDPLAAAAWRPGQIVLDVVYDPWPTELARAAAAAGATVRSGALMLLHQAAAQVELMTGRSAPLDAMRAALPAG